LGDGRIVNAIKEIAVSFKEIASALSNIATEFKRFNDKN
jgi:hypothetical protein